MTSKTSVQITEDEVLSIYNGNYEFLKFKEENLFKEFYLLLSHGLIKPKVIVKYERVAFVHPIGNLRLTFDSHVKTSSNQVNIFAKDIAYISALGAEEVIMEIKFNGVLPDFIKSLIQTSTVMATSSSKYVYSRKYNYSF